MIAYRSFVYVTHVIRVRYRCFTRYRFHGIQAKLPIKSRSALPFFAPVIGHVSPTYLSYPSYPPDVALAISRFSNLISAGFARFGASIWKRSATRRRAIFTCLDARDRQFVCRVDKSSGRCTEKGDPFALSCRTGFSSMPFVAGT